MSLTYGFYDSVTGDRTYTALQFSALLDSIINDGVFMSIGSAFAVSPGTGMQVSVGIGRAWFDHTWTYNDSLFNLTIDTAHATLDRIDTVVIETNSNSGVRANSLKVIKGTAGSSPVPPTLTHTSEVNQYPLADVFVGNGVTSILVGDIMYRVGSSDCPFVTGILETLDIDVIVAQWQDDFEVWFQFLQDELDENQAANLQAQILEHDHSDPLQTLIPTAGLEDGLITLVKMASGQKFKKIGEFVGDGANVPDWSSIPTDFTHLFLIYNGLSTRLTSALDSIYYIVNNDTSAHYYTTLWLKTATQDVWNWGVSNPHAYGLFGGILPAQNAGFLTTGSGLVVFPNYKGTTFYKSAIHYAHWFSSYSTGLILSHSYWNQVTAINRLNGNVSGGYKPRAGSVFSLYGFD